MLEGEDKIFQLQQENWYVRFLMFFLPFVPYHMPQYIMYAGNMQKVGYTKNTWNPARKMLIYNMDEYELLLHGNNYISILKNNTQCALIQKKYFASMEENTYDVQYNSELSPELVVLLTAWIDVVYFHITSNRYEMIKWEKTIKIGKDKYSERLQWKPDGL